MAYLWKLRETPANSSYFLIFSAKQKTSPGASWSQDLAPPAVSFLLLWQQQQLVSAALHALRAPCIHFIQNLHIPNNIAFLYTWLRQHYNCSVYPWRAATSPSASALAASLSGSANPVSLSSREREKGGGHAAWVNKIRTIRSSLFHCPSERNTIHK